MFIAEIFRFAMSKDMELKLKNHFINPNDGNFKEQLNEQIDVNIITLLLEPEDGIIKLFYFNTR